MYKYLKAIVLSHYSLDYKYLSKLSKKYNQEILSPFTSGLDHTQTKLTTDILKRK